MKLTEKDIDQLRSLEESLWIESTRFDKAYMESVLHEDFFEFGRSGKIFTRDEILAIPKGKIEATIPLEEFQVHQIDKASVLVTYVSEERFAGPNRANRCSVWLRTADGWKLRFHQGTTIL